MKELNLKLDYYGALNLHKALLEAKFHAEPDNELVSGSPLVADVYIQVRDFLMESEKGEDWRSWFQLKNRPHYRKRAIMRMKADDHWAKRTFEEKKQVAGNYLAPFLYGEEELAAVVSEAETA